MERKFSFLNAILFALLVSQSLLLVGVILYYSYLTASLNWLEEWPTINQLINFLPRFLLFFTGLAFFILPASLIYEGKKTEWQKLTGLSSLLFLPWLDFIFNFFSNPDWEWPVAILKTSLLWFCGGILAYILGIYLIKKVDLTWLLKLALTLTFSLLLLYVYRQIWAGQMFNNTIEIISWHISLLLYTYSLLKNLLSFKKNYV